MSGFPRSMTAAFLAATLLVSGAAATAWAQGEWVAPPDAKTAKNPVKGVGNGKKTAETNCVSCHGPGGKGDGPAAQALNPKPADWTSPKIAKETDGELFWKISNGRGPMPPWKHLSEKDRWDLIAHVRSLKK
jgi:mono/diheme cytochrome c family protein